MDPTKLDDIARSLATRPTRRAVLTGLGAALVGAVTGRYVVDAQSEADDADAGFGNNGGGQLGDPVRTPTTRPGATSTPRSTTPAPPTPTPAPTPAPRRTIACTADRMGTVDNYGVVTRCAPGERCYFNPSGIFCL